MKFTMTTFLLLLSLVFVVPAHAQPASPAFQDINASFAKEAILELASQGIISGVNPEEFGPEQNIKRGDFAVLLAKVLGIQPLEPEQPTFSDVPSELPGAGYVEALAQLGIMSGAGDGRLGADDPVLRQDVAVMLFRSLPDQSEAESLAGSYLDERQISPYAQAGVGYVTRKGWMRGSEDFFFPLQELTRAEAAVLANQLLSMRRGQALTAIPVVSSRKLELKTGETQKIEPETASIPLAFTPVCGVDNPSVVALSTDGTNIAGKQQGTATVTVNAGLNSYPLVTSVYASQAINIIGSGSAVNSQPVEELASGAAYRVEQLAPDLGFQETEYKSYSGPVEGLTYQGQAWTGFLRQQGRDITVDLKTRQAVSSISLEFLQDAGSGIGLPSYLKAAVSSDGKSWYHLGQVSHNVDPADTVVQSKNLTLSFAPVITRYIKLSFPVNNWVFARQLSVRGGGCADNPAVLAPADNTGLSGVGFLNVPDMKNILLVYTGGNGDDGTWNSKDFQSMVAYQDANGVTGGRMFDTMLFLPYSDVPCTSEGWTAYLEDLFAQGKQLSALDEAVGRLNAISSLSGREKVILTLPYPEPKQNHFGWIQEDGLQLNFSGSAGKWGTRNRLAAVQWFYESLIGRWKQAGLNNLELAGMYWYSESMDQTVNGETELVQDTARLVRDDGLEFFWIPYHGSHGYEDWSSYGFTRVFLQPNFYTVDSPPEERMDRTTDLARRYNLGMELECDGNILYNRYYYDLFYSQLNSAYQLGLDRDITLAWYAGSKALVKAAASSSPQVRAIYDDIYRWVSGTYVPPTGTETGEGAADIVSVLVTTDNNSLSTK
ncbi:MAG: DUF4855 domain-containing protein [Desulfotomaculaceae bacterium]|nr:DUF4855 domain-containing protein [Desulfotomaculaceae bacterium]